MVLMPVLCPRCHTNRGITGGQTQAGQQRYKGQNVACPQYSCLLDPTDKGRVPKIKQPVIDMRLNGRGMRDLARVLKSSPTTVINAMKKRGNAHRCPPTPPHHVARSRRGGEQPTADEAEVAEMWAFVGKQQTPRWRWHALDHQPGHVLAHVFGRRQDKVFLQLKARLQPFGRPRYSTDDWRASTRQFDATAHPPGQRNTPKLARKHLTLRTRLQRLTRKTMCFSRSLQMHAIGIGLVVNRYELGLPV